MNTTKILGHGVSGAVKAVHVAVKQTDKAEAEMTRFLQGHDNIIKYLASNPIGGGYENIHLEVGSSDGFRTVEMNPSTFQGRQGKQIIVAITKQLLSGLIYIHDVMKASHGDMKLQNFVYSIPFREFARRAKTDSLKGDEIKIIDFGSSKHDKDVLSPRSGTDGYMSEDGDDLRGPYERKSDDIFALGVILNHLLDLRSGGHDALNTVPTSSSGGCRLVWTREHCEKNQHHLIEWGLLKLNAADRCTAKEALQRIDAWSKGIQSSASSSSASSTIVSSPAAISTTAPPGDQCEASPPMKRMKSHSN